MEYKKRMVEEENYNNFIQNQFKKQRVKDNMEKLETNVKGIFERMKRRNSFRKKKTA